MQASGFSGFQINQDRARVPAKGRAIVPKHIRFDLGDLPRGEALLVVDVSKNALQQLHVRHAAVARRIADDGHLLLTLRPATSERNWWRESRSTRLRPDAQQREIRTHRLFDVQ